MVKIEPSKIIDFFFHFIPPIIIIKKYFSLPLPGNRSNSTDTEAATIKKVKKT